MIVLLSYLKNNMSRLNKNPILLLAFNRADHVIKSMKAIREYRLERRYLECDGPRPDRGEKRSGGRDVKSNVRCHKLTM